MNENQNLELSVCIKQGEPSCIEKAKNWKIAIVLQDVDVLKYLTETAKKHLEEKMIVKSV